MKDSINLIDQAMDDIKEDMIRDIINTSPYSDEQKFNHSEILKTQE